MEKLHAAQVVVPGAEVRVVGRCPSTNTALLEDSSGLTVLLAAQTQTAGRGRRGRRWYSGAQAITFSLARTLRRPARELAAVSLVAGVACARALREMGAEVSLKWPNDLLAGGAKLGGILVETRGRARVVVGIGINYRADPGLRRRLGRPMASLDALLEPLPPRGLVIGRLARSLMAGLDAFDERGFTAAREAWIALDAYAGQRLRVRLADGRMLTGVAAGLGEDGVLRLQTRAGLRSVRSGTVRPAAGAP